MKRKIYTPLLLTALFMSTLSQTVPGTTANAAKKPALSKTKVSVYTGKKAKVSIKKIAKKTKVTWKLGNKKIAKIVSGVADGCRQADSALIGGETAEMPGFYPIDEYDLAGFSVGIVDKKDMITGKDLKAGDVLVGMASSGIHSNGYSLVRSVFSMKEETLNQRYESLESDLTLGETLLTPTKIYVKALRQIKEAGVRIKACSHITGGGFYENIPRMLKEGTHAKIKKDSFVIPPIFKMLASDGSIAEEAMFNTYNMGVGMITAVDKQDVDKTVEAIKAAGETPYIMGEIVDGEKGITLC